MSNIALAGLSSMVWIYSYQRQVHTLFSQMEGLEDVYSFVWLEEDDNNLGGTVTHFGKTPYLYQSKQDMW